MHRHDMTWIRVLFVLLAAAGIGNASITAAWKIPVENVAPSFADTPPLAKPPRESAFFQAGDKLWDLSKVLKWRVPDDSNREGQGDPFADTGDGQIEVDWKGEWIVWNSRSGMIVACGAWHDLLVAEQVLGCDELPNVIRTRIEVKEAGKSRSLSLVSRIGQKASLEMDDLRAEVEASSSEDHEVIDSPFNVSWPAGDNRGRWSVRTAVSSRAGSRHRIACQGAGDQRWELVVSMERELLDGTPLNGYRWVETAGGLKPWPSSGVRAEPLRKQLDENRWLGVYPTIPGFASHLLKRARREDSADLDPSQELAEWTRSPLVNIREGLADQGCFVSPKGGGFVGLDPLTSTAFVVTDKMKQDQVAETFSGFDDWEPKPPIWIETNPESGGWGLASRSGETAEIRRDSGNLADNLLFRSEATQAGDGVTIDFGYSLDLVASGAKIGKLEANTTLTKDKPQVIGSGTSPDGKEVKVVVTASDSRE